jgi:hypothetical protein
VRAREIMTAAVASPVSTTALAADPLAGATLYEDVRRYETFGLHRYGSAGLDATLAWIADELTRAGLTVTSQVFTLGRQYDFEHGNLAVGNEHRPVMPHWWSPEDRTTFALTALIASDGPDPVPGPAPDAFVRMTLPFDRGAYLNARHRAALDVAFARRPAAVLLTIGHPSGEIFTYNVDQKQAAWPVPVILVAPRDVPLLDAAQRKGQAVSVEVSGAYRRDVKGRNVVARLDRGKDKWIVVSTPVSSWFTSTCERGPGIAGFLAMARLSATRWPDANLVFVATAGHEVGHGGMEVFLRDGAPPPDKTIAWAHFGASLACFEWKRDGTTWTTAPLPSTAGSA